MRILNLPDLFRIQIPHIIYPAFKDGRYLEEYFYNYLSTNVEMFDTINYVYIPVFWTNLQINSDYEPMKDLYNRLLTQAYNSFPIDTKFFTVVQHDDGVLLNIPKSTLIFGGCSGHVPLPLIYEDKLNTLETECNKYTGGKDLTCSFIGSDTHPIRSSLESLNQIPKYSIHLGGWNSNLGRNDTRAKQFIATALRSEFSIAPRGYGRSSFRFFEYFLLNTIPIYIYDDVNWLPYQDILDYSKFSIVIHESEINKLPALLESITSEKKEEMLIEVKKHKVYFTLEYMCSFITKTLKTHKEYSFMNGRQTMGFVMIEPKISLCIPTMDRFDTFLHKYIPLYLENPHINEIIICDENGDDYEKIKKAFSHEKLSVFKNDSRLGVQRNKFNVGSRATSEYVCIFDSDNFADESYFVAFKEFIRKNGPDPNTIYSPSVAGPFNFTNFIGKTITKDNISFSGEGGDMSCLLNTMNFIIPKKLWTDMIDYITNVEDYVDPIGTDSVYFNMIALCYNNCKFEVIPGMQYNHVVHDGSYWLSVANESNILFQRLKERFNKY